MSKLIPFFKKFALAALVLAIGLAALPAAGASGVVPVSARGGVVPVSAQGATGIQDETTPPGNRPANGVVPVLAKHSRFLRISPGSRTGHGAQDYQRLEQIWARAQTAYQRQGDRLVKADEFLTKAQPLINKANQKGWDTSAVKAALNAFTAIIPAAQAAHIPGAAIIASQNGFDADGKVTDRSAAVETVKALGQVLKDTRAAMNGTGQALREAVKAFRDAHRPAQAPATP
ncbi:MAG: hypothetical protein NTW99_08165 [Chloroflexi bacterium]|nr:hypothetical protein [Chloroflexota bacterium]